MKSEVNVLQSIVTPLTEMLSGAKVRVSFKGANAMTLFDRNTGKPTEIVLPVLPGSADQNLIAAYHGYLDHEVGHILFTDMNKRLVKKFEPRVVHTFFNMIEDARIEKKMCDAFRGSKHNLRKVHELVFSQDEQKKLADVELGESNTVIAYSIYAIRALMGQSYFQNAVENCVKLKAFTNFIGEHFADDLVAVNSSDDAANVAKKIVDFFGVEESYEPEESSGDGPSGEDEGSCFGKSDDEKGDADKKESEDGKDSETKSGGKKSEDEKPTDGKDEKEGRDDDRKESKSKYGKLKKDDERDAFEDATSERLKREAEDVRKHSSYSIYTTDDDVVAHGKLGKLDTVQKIDEKTKEMTSVIQKNLERVMAANSLVVWTGGHRKGKLHGASLSRIFTGDNRVFRQKNEARSKDVAVSLVVDCSGSMRIDGRIKSAVYSAYAFCSVLTNMGIACEVLGFTTVGSHQTWDYSRWAGLYIPIFKSFNDRWDTQAKRRLAKPYDDASWLFNNVDGESVQIAANRLLARPEKKKIMIVLSDGEPAADGLDRDLHEHLKETVAELEKYMKIIGIGIDSSSVSDYYKSHVVLNSISDLPTTVIQKVKSLLLAS